MTTQRSDKIHLRLMAALQPSQLEIIDESHLHAGHAGARDGRGHFRVRIQAAAFDGLKTIAIHRLVYGAVDDLMKTDIHALSIEILPPDQTD